MKRVYLLFLLISCTRINAQVDIPELDRMLKYGEVESLEVTFIKIPHAHIFIDKFKLTNLEQEMIGYWTDNYTVKLEQTGMGVKILGIDVFPNRIMCISLEVFEKGKRSRELLYSVWKIELNNLMIKPVFILKAGSDTTIFNVDSVVTINSMSYYIIGRIAEFEKAYVLREQWDFSGINKELNNQNFKLGKDSLRYRILYEHAMPNIYQRIGTDNNLRDFIFNPAYTDPNYYRELTRSHSGSYKTEYK